MIIFSRHAVERMCEMEVHYGQVEDLLLNPEVTYETPAKRGRQVCSVSKAERYPFSVVHTLSEGDTIVVTVVHKTTEQYIRNGVGFLAKDGWAS